jgi:hypothetical protein
LPKDVQKLYNADAEKSDSFCGSSHLKTSWCVTGSWVLWVLCEHNSGMIELKWDIALCPWFVQHISKGVTRKYLEKW